MSEERINELTVAIVKALQECNATIGEAKETLSRLGMLGFDSRVINDRKL